MRLCDRCALPDEARFLQGYIAWDYPCERCGLPNGYGVYDGAIRLPWPTGWPVAFRTCSALALVNGVVWDTNRYYRDLGVGPRATKREIREAYIRLGGQASPRLTYIVHQLLDDDVRRRYDATPPGSLFRDEYVEWMIRDAEVQHVHARRRAGLEAVGDDADWPFETVLDEDGAEGQDEPNDGRGLVSHPAATTSLWGYFRWQAKRGDHTWQVATWRGLVAAAVYRREGVLELAVGIAGGMEPPWSVELVGNLLVVFLNESEQPSAALAEQVAARVAEVRHRSPAWGRTQEEAIA